MKRFTDAGRQAIADDNFFAGLSLALIIPEICGSLEDPGPNKSKCRYERWFRKWAEPKFSGPIGVIVSAEDCYQLRCSLFHSGTTEIAPEKVTLIERFVFFDKTDAHLTTVIGNVVGGVRQKNFVQLSADKFSETMYSCAEEWDASVACDKAIQAGKDMLLKIHPKGKVIGPIRFS